MKVKELSSDAKNRRDARNKKLKDAGFEPVKEEQKRKVLSQLLRGRVLVIPAPGEGKSIKVTSIDGEGINFETIDCKDEIK